MNIQQLRPLHVLVFREAEWWIAQCLEFDLAAHASTMEELVYEFEKTLVGTFVVSHENGLPGLDHLPPAPEVYSKLFMQAVMRVGAQVRPRFQGPLNIPPAFMIPEIRMRMQERIN